MIRENLKRYLAWEVDYRTGETNPLVGTGTPAATAMQWVTGDKGRALSFKDVTAEVSYGAIDPLGTGNITLIVLAKPESLGNTVGGRFIDNGKTYLYFSAANRLGLTSDASTIAQSAASAITYNIPTVVGVTRTSAGVTNFFVNGTQSGTRNQSSGTPVAGNTNLFVGGSNTASRQFDGQIYYLAIYNTILTEQQISQLSDELMTEKTITLPAIRTQSDINLFADGDMEMDGTTFWPAVSGAGSKETTTPYRNKQCLRLSYTNTVSPYIIVNNVTTVGKYYRLTGYYRIGGGSNGQFRAYSYNGGFNLNVGGTATSWTKFDVTFYAGTVGFRFYLLNGTSGYLELDDMKLIEIPSTTSYQPVFNPAYLDNSGVGWNRSFGNETTGELSNTGFRILSGSWQVENAGDVDKRKKQITCKGTGAIAIPLSVPYGAYRIDIYKGVDSNIERFMPIASAAAVYNDASQNGYMLQLSNNEAVYMYSVAAGTPTTRLNTNASYIATTGWNSFLIKRYPGGVFYTYIRLAGTGAWTLLPADSGANPFTNNTYTTGQYAIVQLGTNGAFKNFEEVPDFATPRINGIF